MKKNIAMRVAAFLFILTMISTCAFATTFAKYITADDAHDSARVAKWGVTVEVTGDAFSNKYIDEAATTGNLTVEAKDKVVAPGTKGTLFVVTIAGTPEVDAEVELVFDIDFTDWTVDGNFYCPLEIEVGGNVYAGKQYKSAEEFSNAIKDAVLGTARDEDTATYQYGANTSVAEHSVTVNWEWAFKGNDDVKDTALGDAAAAKISFSIECTVTQID